MSEYIKYLEFLAGKMNFDPTTKKVTPNTSKGKIIVFHNIEGETHFQWHNLDTKSLEFDLFVFAQDAKFVKVVKSNSRVYILSFQSNDDKFFFWMQDPSSDNDEKNCKLVNEIINFENNEEEMQIEEEHKAPVEQPKPSTNPNQQDLLLKFTNQIQQAFKRMSQGAEKDTPCLSEVLKSEFLTEISNDKEFQEALIPLLPEGRQTVEEFKETLKSPQFLQALDSLDKAVNSESGDGVLASLNLDPSSFLQNFDGSDALYKELIKLFKK